MRREIVIFLILFNVIFFNTSCARVPIKERPSDYHYYKEKLKEINKSDGISREEAIIIAQNYAIEQGLDKDYIITNPTVKDFTSSNDWEITFKATYGESIKQGGIFGSIVRWWICVHLDKRTGVVKSMGGPDL